MKLKVVDQQCLTPLSQIKSIFYLTLQAAEPNQTFEYQPGDWLTVEVANPADLVDQVLALLALNGSETIVLRRDGEMNTRQALTQHLEITQLNPAILNKIQRQFGLGDWADRQAMIDFAYGRDIIDLLQMFPELIVQGVEFLTLLAPLAPRYYSIASATSEHHQVSILYRAVQYQTDNRQRFGVASNFLSQLKSGDTVMAELKANPTFKMPEQADTAMIMVAAGTGLAPFIGFMQQREALQKSGVAVAKSILFFGEVSQKEHCLLCDKLQHWQQMGLLESELAFSRDQSEKFYVQHRLLQQADSVWKLLDQGAHLYICGNQNTLSEAVKTVLMQIFVEQGSMSDEQAEAYWQALRKAKRLQLDVY